MSENTSIADSLNKDGVMVEPMMPAQGGVPAPETKAVEPTAAGAAGIATQGTSDAGASFEAKMAEVQANYERDMRRMQSSLQKNAAQERQEYEQRMSQMESELHAARTAGMNEQERLQYERDVYAQRADMLAQQVQQTQQRLYDWENRDQAVEAFRQLGVPPEKLKGQSTEQILQAGWMGIAERMAELEARATASQPAPRLVENQPPPSPGLTPPATASAQGTPTGGRTWGDAYTAASNILGTTIDNEEDLMRAVEQGHLPPSIIPGLGR